ncbi:MAG: response regulator [Gaiellaceae bacterium]
MASETSAAIRVLVADDERPIRLLCRVNLELEGMEVVEAADGSQAVEQALADPPDVAVLDVAMPGLDGWQVAERLRQEERTRSVAVVFLTAMTGPDAERLAKERGGMFVAKPFNPLELAGIVRRASGGRRSRS